MCIEVSWYNENKTVLIHDISGKWTITDIRHAAVVAWDMMRSVSHQVDVIIDVRNGNRLPSGFMVHGKHIATTRPDNAGVIVIVGANTLMKSLYDVYSRSYGRATPDFRVYFTDDLPSAENIINDNQSAGV
ncbi:MAG: hypothetical protein ACPG7F_14910 [Aggregatilineales bacterium]